jgi:preprotein translocase subunit SecE
MFARLTQYLKETSQEMRRVSWPSLPELRESTVVVLVTVTIITFFIFVVDKVFDFIMKRLISLA